MDSQKPTNPGNLLNDLESIRQLLEQSPLEPPLLTDSIDPNSIPLLSEIINPADLGAPLFSRPAQPSLPPAASATPVVPSPQPAAPLTTTAPAPAAITAPTTIVSPAATINEQLQRSLHPAALELNRLDRELRSAAQLLLQDVIDDFVPQIEAELKRRLDLQLTQLLNQRKR
jgi:hypothetical protein